MTAAFMAHQEGYGRILVIGRNVGKSGMMGYLRKKLFPLGTVVLPVDLNYDQSEFGELIPWLDEKVREQQSSSDIVAYVRKGKTETKVENLEALATLFD